MGLKVHFPLDFVKAIEPVFGAINIEDIESPKIFDIIKRLQNELSIPVFHDDQHGTAVITLAALINFKIIEQKNRQYKGNYLRKALLATVSKGWMQGYYCK